MNKNSIIITVLAFILAACSSTSSLGEGEVLYTGQKPIKYNDGEPCTHLTVTKEELEAALATPPNGSLLGSSTLRSPFPYTLWIWNACEGKKNIVAKWLKNSFGKAPVLLNNVNPKLRASVAKSVLESRGYLNGEVDYTIIDGKPERTRNDSTLIPRTAKLQYDINFGRLFRLDSISYSNYPEDICKHICQDSESLLKKDDPFCVSTLDGERQRIYNKLRNKGFYYYQKPYTSYLADTLQVPGKVQLLVHCADSLPEEALKKWVIGKTTMQIRRTSREELSDSMAFRYLTIRFGGKKPALRPRIILSDMKMRPGDLFSQDKLQESLNALTAKGIFSTADITFKPRYNADGTIFEVPDTIKDDVYGEERIHAGVLDMYINTVLDKPYDFSFQANAKGKTNGRVGPGVAVTLSKRNAFRNGELLSLSAGADYEFQTGGNSTAGHSYSFNLTGSIQMPRLLFPSLFGRKHRRWYTTPATAIILSGETVRRAGFFNRNILSASFDYTMQPTATSIHQFSPLTVTYGHTTSMSEEYLNKIEASPYTLMSTQDEMILKMRYRYIYSSPESYRNPLYMDFTISEAGNIASLIAMAAGEKWQQRDKKILGTPYSQFVKVEADIRKTWNFGNKNSLVAHFHGGLICSFGNEDYPPFGELFYVGGANDLRGFSMRSIGPGTLHLDDKKMGYIMHNGDLKLIGNLEYRPHLFGSLYGAIFLDVGNVWSISKEQHRMYREEFGEAFGNPTKLDLGVDVGVGLRYDLDFFVLRLDWGFAIHNPYDTGKGGFFNTLPFKKMQCLNLGIGYPF